VLFQVAGETHRLIPPDIHVLADRTGNHGLLILPVADCAADFAVLVPGAILVEGDVFPAARMIDSQDHPDLLSSFVDPGVSMTVPPDLAMGLPAPLAHFPRGMFLHEGLPPGRSPPFPLLVSAVVGTDSFGCDCRKGQFCTPPDDECFPTGIGMIRQLNGLPYPL